MWKIIDLNKNKYSEISDCSIISIGNVEDCEIKITTIKEAPTIIQFVLENKFIYFVHGKKINVYINKYEFCLFDFKFLIEKINQNEDFFNVSQDYQEIQKIYSSTEFIRNLCLVQKNLLESKNFILNKLEFSKQEVITESCSICDSYFWDEHNVFEESHRDKYKKMIWMIYAQICEYGILTLPLLDNQVSEIMVNDFKKIFFERNGLLSLSPLEFNFESDLYSIIERICSSIGRRIDESIPYCDARLKDGSRVHAIIPPLALNGPCLTIRKFPKHEISLEKLVEIGSISTNLLSFLKKIIIRKKNVLISGGTGSGKTTLLNCLSRYIPADERIITIEDSAELKLQQEHVIRLESRPENIEKKGLVTMRDLVKNSLRMRPDRIIVGECRGGEALDMLQAMNTGHDGSMTTIHANSPIGALRRLETLVLFAEFDLPSRAVREQISSSIQYIVQQSRLSNGFRCITKVHKMIGLCESSGNFLTKSIYSRSKKIASNATSLEQHMNDVS